MNYKGGRLANRIYAFGHFIVNSIEHNYKLYNPEFDEYNSFFEATSKNYFDGYQVSTTVFKSHLADRAFSRIFRLWADVSHKLIVRTPLYVLYRIFKTNDKNATDFDLNDPGFLNDAKKKVVLTEGWNFRDRINFLKHADLIRKFFTPVEKYRILINDVIDEARKEADVIIGVHIRKGDYIRYNKGIWFYSDEVYGNKMMQLHDQVTAKVNYYHRL